MLGDVSVMGTFSALLSKLYALYYQNDFKEHVLRQELDEHTFQY